MEAVVVAAVEEEIVCLSGLMQIFYTLPEIEFDGWMIEATNILPL